MAEPQVPSIAPVSSAPQGQPDDIGALLTQTAAQATQTLPPQYVQGTSIAQPNIRPVVPYTPQNDNRQPLNNQATSLQQARRQNAFASLANVVGKAGQALQQQKQDRLKNDLKEVMTARENIANANAVLQTDPNNQMAKNVLAANKKSLEAILNDPKKAKQLEKALDVNFTDPDKNKTPEIKAYQDAMKDFKEAGIFNSDNPEEAKIAAMAAQGKTAPPPTASNTSRADQVLAKDLPNIQQNPQYAVAQKQQQDAQRQLNQYVLPRVIAAEAAKQVQLVKDGNAAARAEYKATMDFQRDAQKQIAALNLQNQKAKDAMQLQVRRDADAMSRVQTEVNARLKIAEDKRLDPGTSMKLKTEALDKIDASLKNITAERLSLASQLKTADTDEEKETLGHLLDYNTIKAKATNEYRQKIATDIYGRVGEQLNDRTGTAKPVGSNLSDEPDEDDDSDDY